MALLTGKQQLEHLGPRSGNFQIKKGQAVAVRKTSTITASASWKSVTDYDIYALVLFTDGHVETVSQFGTKKHPHDFTPSVANGAIKHLGDIGREAQGDAVETVEISLTDDIAAVAIVAYSAQSNGTGSFYRYKVGLKVDNGAGAVIGVSAENANDDDQIYTCVPAIIRNTPKGVDIEAVELYSKRSSEKRPAFNRHGDIEMDAGPENAYK
ncbi:MAG TPA: hypothetical protein VG992_03845 [Candidatus Saccharimonadales bacterium]|nr:hypothetical protein [Candidatus Saccharimonadales bacterium]